MTHDLLVDVLGELEAKCVSVAVTAIALPTSLLAKVPDWFSVTASPATIPTSVPAFSVADVLPS